MRDERKERLGENMNLEPSAVSTSQGKYFGNHIGRAESTEDPDRMMRVQVRDMVIHTAKVPKADLPWAEYLLPIGARVNDGFFTPVDVGDWVWLDYPYSGDPRRPRIIGSVHHAPGKVPNFPHESFAGPEKLAHKTTGEEPSPINAEYHKNIVWTQHGVTIEVNEDKSVSITQRATGTAIRVSPQGDITLHGEKNVFLSAIENLRGVIAGGVKVNVAGKTEVVSMEGISLDGGSADLSGVVTKLCICPFTGKPHSDYSAEVVASKG
jgi:hypothetical protein